MRLALDRFVVDAQQAAVGAAEVAAQPGPALHRADEFVATPGAPVVGAVDEAAQVGDEVGSHLRVAVGLGGVVADNEPLRPCAVPAVAGAAGGDVDLLDPQVARDCAIAAGRASAAAASALVCRSFSAWM